MFGMRMRIIYCTVLVLVRTITDLKFVVWCVINLIIWFYRDVDIWRLMKRCLRNCRGSDLIINIWRRVRELVRWKIECRWKRRCRLKWCLRMSKRWSLKRCRLRMWRWIVYLRRGDDLIYEMLLLRLVIWHNYFY